MGRKLLGKGFQGETPSQPRVDYGHLPVPKTTPKLVNRCIWRRKDGFMLTGVSDYLRYQYWKNIDFQHGKAGVTETIKYSETLGLSNSYLSEISSELGVKVDALSSKISARIQQQIAIEQHVTREKITKVPPQASDWYLAVYQLIDVYEIFVMTRNFLSVNIPVEEIFLKELKDKSSQEPDFTDLNTLKELYRRYCSQISFGFQSISFEVPTVLVYREFDPPIEGASPS